MNGSHTPLCSNIICGGVHLIGAQLDGCDLDARQQHPHRQPAACLTRWHLDADLTWHVWIFYCFMIKKVLNNNFISPFLLAFLCVCFICSRLNRAWQAQVPLIQNDFAGTALPKLIPLNQLASILMWIRWNWITPVEGNSNYCSHPGVHVHVGLQKVAVTVRQRSAEQRILD